MTVLFLVGFASTVGGAVFVDDTVGGAAFIGFKSIVPLFFRGVVSKFTLIF